MKKHVSKPPSRIKYDSEHPTVSARVTKELRGKLDELQKKSGKSLGDILREALKVQKPMTEKAYASGYEDARRKYAVVYQCSVCGEDITITSEKAKRAAVAHMMENGWRHSACGRQE